MSRENLKKARQIVDMYSNREFRQEDIAKALEIPIDVVRKVTKIYGFEHGKLKSNCDPNNLNSGQKINPVIFEDELAFLDPYDIQTSEHKKDETPKEKKIK